MLGPHSEQAGGHRERGLELVRKARQRPTHVVRATGHCVGRQIELLDRTKAERVRETDNARLGPRDDLIVSFSVAVVEGAPLGVARPIYLGGGRERQAFERGIPEDGFDVGAQRSAHDGVSVENKASKAMVSFDHVPRSSGIWASKHALRMRVCRVTVYKPPRC
jgi:hypothetical protein